MPKQNHRALMLSRLILSAALIGVVPAISRAQVAPVVDDAASPAGVTVPESPGAAELLGKTRDKELQKQWKTAAEFYQDALVKYPGRVVPLVRDSTNGIYHYSGIAPLVQERISKWPAEGLTLYRNLYGPAATDLLAAAPRGDTAALRTIFWNYFVTDAGKTAGIRLIDNCMESGDFTAAIWFGNRLLDLHPFLAADRAMITYRTALACQWAGETQQAKTLLNRLKQESPKDIGTIAGKDVLLIDALTSALAAVPPTPTTRPADADTYPSYGGLGGRGDMSPSSAKFGASLNSVALTPPDFSGMSGTPRNAFQPIEQQTLNANMAMGIMPVVDNGALFFQDGRCVYAVDADSGAPLPGWLNTYSGERFGRYKINVPGRARNELLTVTVSPSFVLAVVGQPDRSTINNQFAMGQGGLMTSTAKLVCLDRETGRETWTRTPADLPESAAAIKLSEYCGTPLIIPANQAGPVPGSTGPAEDSVLIVARGSKDNQFDDCYIVCLSEKTGQYRWSTYVGSATRNFDQEGLLSEDPSAMALADGRVFIMTNLGTVEALDPADGRMLWANSYNRQGGDNAMAAMRGRMRFGGRGGFGGGFGGAFINNGALTGNNRKVWAHNPVVVSGGNVFALPSDTDQLFVYDAGTGVEKKRLAMSDFDNAAVLLGVSDGIIYLNSDKIVTGVNWEKFKPGLSDPELRLARPFFTDISFKDISIVCGRGFITADSVFIPTKNRLVQIVRGRIVEVYPKRDGFNGDQGPGNLLVTAHNVVVAGQTRVDVYTDLSLVRQKYELAMSASPSDPLPRVQYAEALFSGGQTDAAIAKVDDAISLIGGLNSMHSGKDRNLIFNAMLEFARRAGKIADPAKKAEAVAYTNQFYDRAAAAAESPLESATYRLARAAFDHEQKDAAAEIRLCQEVLSNDAMRSVALSDDTNAAAAAEAAIDVALAGKRSAYQPIEDQAAGALKDARAAHDPKQLLAVATIYPNSKAAIDARQDAVHLFEATNQSEQAIAVLRRMYASSNAGVNKAYLLESIANDFLTLPDGLGPAIDRLCRAARSTPDQKLSQPLVLPDGTKLAGISYADAIAKLRQMQADQDTARLPDFHLAIPKIEKGMPNPFVHGVPAVISNVTALVKPLRDFNRMDQILTWSANGLSMYAAGATTPTFTVPEVKDAPLANAGAAYVRDHWLVWTTTQLFQIDAEGKVAWTFTVDKLPTLLVSTGGEGVVDDTGETVADDGTGNPPNPRFIRVNGQLIRVQGNGGVVIQGRRGLRMGGGIVPVPPPPIPVQAAARSVDETIVAVQPGGPGGDRILVSTSTGRVLALDGRGGQTIWQTRLVDHAVDQLAANGHFTVLRLDDTTGSQIAVFDTPTGKLAGKRRFGPDGSPTQLVNVALSEEATLAITLYSQVKVKDLYEPWKTAPVEMLAQANRDAAPFVGLNQPDQLVVKAGRLVTLYDGGQYLRGYDLSKNADPTNPMQTYANSNAVSLHMVGPRVFILTSTRMLQHNLENPSDFYTQDDSTMVGFLPHARQLMVGKDYLMLLYDPVDRGPAGSPFVGLVCYHRSWITSTNREIDSPDATPTIRSSTGITDWLAAEGGVYYLTKDGNLHLLRGAR